MGFIKLLDCTLRDGGHINQGTFGYNVIKSIVSNLVKAGIDIIEIGFLWDSPTDKDTARFHTISELKELLPKDMAASKISLMADNVDLTHLEDNDGTVEYIRLSFRKKEFMWAEQNAKVLMKKGYKVYINPIHGSAISDKDYLQIIERVNKLKPYGFSIVDTFGALRQEDLGRIYYLIEHNLDKDITVGLHLHANLGLAYSLAQYILNIAAPTRNITIDGSLYGMGKVPGNLCIEQIMDYMNVTYRKQYSTEPVYDAIDDYIMPIYEKVTWGYAIPYALSAQYSVHRTYAEFFQEKERLHTKDMRRLLGSIDKEHKEIFNIKYAEELYSKYINVEVDDALALSTIKSELTNYDDIIILAPGASIQAFDIKKYKFNNACVISVNFVYDKSDIDFVFFTNSKRIDNCGRVFDREKMLITSNLIKDVEKVHLIFSRNELVYHDDVYCDDSTLMLINLLNRIERKKIHVAGFDGFLKNKNNFYDISYERTVRKDDYDADTRKKILKRTYSSMQINFLTPSLYQS